MVFMTAEGQFQGGSVRIILNLVTSDGAHSGVQCQLPGANQDFFNHRLYLNMYHTRLSHRRGLAHSPQPKKERRGDSDIRKSSIPVHTSIYMVFKKNWQSQPIISNDSTISSRLQMKTQPYKPIPQ